MEDRVRAFVQAIVQQSHADTFSVAASFPWQKCTNECDLCKVNRAAEFEHTQFSKYFPSLFERYMITVGTNAPAYYKVHGKQETDRVLRLFLFHSDAICCFQVLISLIKSQKCKDVYFVLEQLAKFLKANRIFDMLLSSCTAQDKGENDGVSTGKAAVTEIAENELARSMVNLPELVANYASASAVGEIKAKSSVFDNFDEETASVFTRTGYFASLFNAVLESLRVSRELMRNAVSVDTRFHARLVGAICLHAELRSTIWSSCLLHLIRERSEESQNAVTATFVRKLAANIPSSSFRDCLIGLFDAASSHLELSMFLGELHAGETRSERQRVEAFEFAVKREFGTTLQKKSIATLRNVLVFLAIDLERLSFLRSFFDEMLAKFVDRATLQFLDLKEMRYLCAALLIMYGLLTRANTKQVADVTGLQQTIMNKLMYGVQANLQNTRTDLKSLALCAVELIVNHANGYSDRTKTTGDGEEKRLSKLDFGLSESDDIRLLRALFGDVLSGRFETAIDRPKLDTQVKSSSSSKKVDERPADGKALPKAKHMEVAANWLASKKLGKVSKPAKPSQPIDSDDEDYPQFDTSHDTTLPSGVAPKYIRELLENLLQSGAAANNADAKMVANFEASLHSAASLIRLHPRSSREACLELADALLDLNDSFGTPNFDEDRLKALVELCAIAPERVADRLVVCFFQRDNSLRRRLDVLETLKRSALRLARLDEAGVPLDTREQPESVDADEKPGKNVDWRKIVDDRIAAKTRIVKPESLKKQREAPQQEGKANDFAKVAGYFYFPLLRDFDRKVGAFDMLDEDNACQLLATYFQTIAILHYCCSLSLPVDVAQRVARVFFDVLFLVRFHRDQDVRRNVHVALFTLLSLVPATLLVDDFAAEISELRSWLTEVASNDCNDDVRKISQQTIVLVGTKLQEELQSRSQEQ